ncbi:MAG: hypothetical protein ACJ76P_11300 [Actinomycetota bacterium]
MTFATGLPNSVAGAEAYASTRTFVTMYSQGGDYIGGGVSRSFYAWDSSISVSGDDTSMTVTASGGASGTSFTFFFSPRDGQHLHDGLYFHAARGAFGHAGIDIFGDGRGCNNTSGRFEVLDLATWSGGAIRRLSLIYEQHCEGGVPALFGQIDFHEPEAPSSYSPAPDHVWFPDVDAGGSGAVAEVDVTVRPSSPALTLGSSHLRGADPDAFAVRVDACDGQTVQPGSSCPVFVRFIPLTAGPFTALLKIPDSTGHLRRVPLDGFAIGGRTSVSLRSDAGDYIGGGRDYQYGPGNATITASGTYEHLGGNIQSKAEDWTWSFDAPDGDVLAPGSTYHARRYPFNGIGAGMNFYGEGRGCDSLKGPFTVNALAFNEDGSVRTLSIDFTQHCEGDVPALHGKIRFLVPVGDATPPNPVGHLTLTRAHGGGSAHVTWRNPASDFDHVLVRYFQGTPPMLPNSGVLAYSGRGTETSIQQLDPSKPIAVAVFTVDGSGNVGVAATATV